MKALVLGDLHLKMVANNRTDDILATQIEKLRTVAEIAEREEVDVVIQTGDTFDSPKPNVELIVALAEVINKGFGSNTSHNNDHTNIFSTLGQHDMYMRTGLAGSPMRIMEKLCDWTVIQAHEDPSIPCSGVRLYGCAFGEEPPEPADPDTTNVLIIHKMIHSKPLFPGDTDFQKPRAFLDAHPAYNAIFCGDYHGSFLVRSKDGKQRIILNPGAVTRQTIRDADERPKAIIWDSETGEISSHWLCDDNNPFREVMRNADGDGEGSLELESWLESLRTAQSAGVSFEDILIGHCDKTGVRTAVREMLLESIEEAKEHVGTRSA